MKTIERENGGPEAISFSGPASPAANVLTPPGDLCCAGELVAAVRKIRGRWDDLLVHLLAEEFKRDVQPGGGAQERVVFSGGKHWGKPSRERTWMLLLDLADIIEEKFREVAPEQYQRHRQAIRKVPLEDRISDGSFTTVVINKDSRAGFHTDDGYLEGTFGAMFVLKGRFAGGNLVFPQLETEIRLPDRSLLIFDGRRFSHGVTAGRPSAVSFRNYCPFIPRSVRLTLVFHARRN